MTTELRARVESLSAEDQARLVRRLRAKASQPGHRPLRYSLFFFADRGSEDGPLYDLLLECARFADENGFEAIWTPERHFHDFGAPYSAPPVLSAALAMVTKRLKLRAGSVVLPLNDVVRVAEAWSVVDNLSGGRVGVSLASGWHPDDFILSRSSYDERHRVFAQQIPELIKLWRGEATTQSRTDGTKVSIQIKPRPVQSELPIWVTTSRNPATWTLAGQLGANVLTGLMEQPLERVAELVRTYRAELERQGIDPRSRQVTVMMHTFVYDDGERDRASVENALAQYLRSHMKFYETMMNQKDMQVDVNSLTEEDRDTLIRRGVERYVGTSALIGTISQCRRIVERLVAAQVDELACLVNFGVPRDALHRGLQNLAGLMSATAPAGVVARV